MDFKKALFPMQKLEVITVDEATEQRHVYYSRIEETTEKSITITAPYGQKTFLLPRYQEQYMMRIAGNGCAYLFWTYLLDHARDPIPMWMVAWPTEIRRIQMRSFVRLDIVMEITVQLYTHMEDEPQIIRLFTKDISGNGVSLVWEQPMPIGAWVKIFLPVDSAQIIEVEGEVLRVIPHGVDDANYAIIVKLKKIQEAARAKLLRFIFSKQIERRNRDLQRQSPDLL